MFVVLLVVMAFSLAGELCLLYLFTGGGLKSPMP